MRYWKYSGAGNDFVLLDGRSEALGDHAELARTLCDRENGIGADGLMILLPPQNGGQIRMAFYNNDGSAAEMCGNGARCLCRHCFDEGICGQTQMIETPAGMVYGKRISEDRYTIRLNRPSEVRLQIQADETLCDYVVLGENGIPHAAVCVDFSENRAILRDLARNLRFHSAFPKGANVNLYSIVNEDHIRLLTYERGVENFTLACGTGTGATVYALCRRGLVRGRDTRVDVDGGILSVDIADGEIYLTGPAERIASGELPQL